MKFTVDGKAFQQQLQAVSKVVNAKNSLNILDNFLLQIEGDVLSIMGSDQENSLVARMTVTECDGDGIVAIPARKLLETLGYDASDIDRICYLIAHHHTYKDIDGADYQILVEADFLVNLYEDRVDRHGIEAAYRNIFRTESGKQLCQALFGISPSH